MRKVVSLWLPFWPTERRRRRDAVLPADAPLVTCGHDRRRLVVDAACPVARAPELAFWRLRPLPLTAVSL